MTHPIGLRDDPRIRSIEWHDLRVLGPWQKLRELTVSLPWFAGSIAAFGLGWIPIGVVCSFLFFLTALRQAHGAQHYSIGVGRLQQDLLLLALSVVMGTSLHALQATHLHHHRACLEPSDIESRTAQMPWWKALLYGPWFIVQLNAKGFTMSKANKRRWIRIEWLLAGTIAAVVLLYGPTGLRWFVGTMLLGECFTGFFAVWTVHHGCDPHHDLARTQRGWLKNFISYDMFFHLEHHLFPAVPTPRLPELAARFDAALPDLRTKQVF